MDQWSYEFRRKKKYFIIGSFQNAWKDSRTLNTKVEKDSRTNIKGNTVYEIT